MGEKKFHSILLAYTDFSNITRQIRIKYNILRRLVLGKKRMYTNI